MYAFQVSDRLQKILEKLARKNNGLHEQVLNKISEITNSSDIEHYKNLRYSLSDSKRVHIGHFVLVFQFDKKNNLINFDDFDHHDNIYLK